MGNDDRVEPANAAICRPRKLSAAIIVTAGAPGLILKTVSAAIGVIDGEPLLIATVSGRNVRPGLPAVERTPHVVEESLEQAEVEKLANAV